MKPSDKADNFVNEGDDADALVAKPHTATVLLLLMIAAATFSYLGAYAVTTALANAEIIRPISHEHDPRLRWAMIGFVSLMCSFGVIAAVLRTVSRSQFRRIDQMNDGED